MKKAVLLILACLLVLSLLPAVPSAYANDSQSEALAQPAADNTEKPETTEPSEPTDPSVPTEPTQPEPREDEIHKPLMSGSNDGCFHPKDTLSRAEMAVVLYSQGNYAPGQNVFPDVKASAWYATAVNALAAAGILGGYPDGKFQPKRAVTRAELVAALAKVSGETATRETDFQDIPANFWGRDAISLAQEKGWVSGYSDGTFRPNQTITRAEAATVLIAFFRRSPDLQAIERGENLHFFPDVASKSWYYPYVMEASTVHTAHWETVESSEVWLNVDPGNVPLSNGFYCVGGKLYAVREGSFIHKAETGTLNGLSYTCEGASGVCTVRTEVLPLYDGTLLLLSGGKPIAKPGKLPNGLFVKAGQLYAVQNGSVLQKQTTGTIGGVSYTCTGASGVCTTPDWMKLQLSNVSLSVFDNALTDEAKKTGSDVVTVAEALKAIVKAYEAYFRVEYPLTNGTNAQYIQKALDYGILGKAQTSYTDAVTRRELCYYLCRAFRWRELEAVNEIEVIPDVPASSDDYKVVMTLYRTGIMGGVDDAHNASLNGTVKWTEMGGLLTRLEQRNKRLRFTIKEKTVKTIQYGTSGSGRYALTACQIGNGKNVMVLTFAIHGWEDNYDRDGADLVYLADQVRDWLVANYDLVKNGNWTVYVLRCLNPDGLYLGTTCNGKGRCTTTWVDANGTLRTDHGIDMNRCFPYLYQRFTDARNYNGTAPLQCKEAKALSTFVKSVKGSGYNICVDTHGWYGQVITSTSQGTLGKTFMKQFPNNTYASLGGGKGYFSSWAAYAVGYDACLLELPRGIYSHSTFLSKGCVWRFENAIQELLQHYNGPRSTRGVFPYETVPFVDNGN